MSTATETQFTCETLPLNEWEALLPIFNDEFDSDLPHYKYGTIIGIKDEGELIGFITLESLIQVGRPYISMPYRHSNAKGQLFAFIEKMLRQSSRSVIMITEEPRIERLAQSYGMREVGKTWRVDL